MKKIIEGIVLALAVSSAVFAVDSASAANRRTAIRCMKNASSSMQDSRWTQALSQASLGLSYDDSISDLWYLLAASGNSLGKHRFEIMPYLEKAVSLDKWVGYNRDNARIMYADILSDTGMPQKAIDMLDMQPKIYSADAEYIRVKSYYRLGTPSGRDHAFSHIDSARKVYSDDIRFPVLFFRNEDPSKIDANRRRLADVFITNIYSYSADPDKTADLEINAVPFCDDEKKTLMLRTFAAKNLSHEKYPLLALETGVIDEKKAFSIIKAIADEKIDFNVLASFMDALKDEGVVAEAREYFRNYGGVITRDMDFDGMENVFAKYSRGRPASVFYDFNQDGRTDFTVNCDFGVPVSGRFEKRGMSFAWTNFPCLSEITFSSQASFQRFNIIDDTLRWVPVKIEEFRAVSEKTGFAFFFPEFNLEERDLTNRELIDSSSSFFVDGCGDNGGSIEFMLHNGDVTGAVYTSDGKVYAEARFIDNLPDIRLVDVDRDGVFETTEVYAVDGTRSRKVHSLEDERQIMQNVFGYPLERKEFYLKMVQVDTDHDTVPDFTEEYLDNGGVISSWDTDSTGKWNYRHVLYPSDNGDVLEDSFFHVFPGDRLVCVSSRNGVPFSVRDGDLSLKVMKGSVDGFWWLGKGDESFSDRKYEQLAKKAVEKLMMSTNKSDSCVLEDLDLRVCCIKFADLYYGIPLGGDL